MIQLVCCAQYPRRVPDLSARVPNRSRSPMKRWQRLGVETEQVEVNYAVGDSVKIIDGPLGRLYRNSGCD